MVKVTGCSSGGPRFDPQYPRGSSQWSVTLVRKDPIPSFGLCGHCMHLVHRCTCSQSTHTYKNKKKIQKHPLYYLGEKTWGSKRSVSGSMWSLAICWLPVHGLYVCPNLSYCQQQHCSHSQIRKVEFDSELFCDHVFKTVICRDVARSRPLFVSSALCFKLRSKNCKT